MGVRREVGIAIALIAVATLAIGAAPASAALPGIMVFDSDSGDPAAAFKKLKCRIVNDDDGVKRFKVASRDNGWKLTASINGFTGYHEYEIPWHIGKAGFIVKSPSGTSYANFNEPPDPHPETGGAIAFPSGRKVLGLGFINAFDPSISSGIALGGQGACKYPRRR